MQMAVMRMHVSYKKLKESKECDSYAMYNNFSRKKSKL